MDCAAYDLRTLRIARINAAAVSCRIRGNVAIDDLQEMPLDKLTAAAVFAGNVAHYIAVRYLSGTVGVEVQRAAEARRVA